MSVRVPAAQACTPRMERREKKTVSEKMTEYLERRPATPETMYKIRRLILTEGLDGPDIATLRPRIWKLMLEIDKLDVESYLHHVALGPSEVSAKIKNDTFRTLATDTQFQGKVKEDMLIRLLEAFVWKNTGTDHGGLPFSYVQGMNVLAAPFLYVMPSQIEAFACFATFIERVHKGLALLDRCLEHFDADLYDFLRGKNLTAEIYAFPSVLTLCACTPPLDEVLKLWDFLFAYGVHLNILAIVAQLHLLADQIYASPSPMKMLRNFPPFEARQVVAVTMIMANDLPEDLYMELAAHPTGIATRPMPEKRLGVMDTPSRRGK